MPQQNGWLKDTASPRALAFVQALARTKPAVILGIARNTVVDDSRATLVRSLEESLVASGRTVEAWHVEDAVRTALHPLHQLAMGNRARARLVGIAWQLSREAALALLADGTISPSIEKELCRPFLSLL